MSPRTTIGSRGPWVHYSLNGPASAKAALPGYLRRSPGRGEVALEAQGRRPRGVVQAGRALDATREADQLASQPTRTVNRARPCDSRIGRSNPGRCRVDAACSGGSPSGSGSERRLLRQAIGGDDGFSFHGLRFVGTAMLCLDIASIWPNLTDVNKFDANFRQPLSRPMERLTMTAWMRWRHDLKDDAPSSGGPDAIFEAVLRPGDAGPVHARPFRRPHTTT